MTRTRLAAFRRSPSRRLHLVNTRRTAEPGLIEWWLVEGWADGTPRIEMHRDGETYTRDELTGGFAAAVDFEPLRAMLREALPAPARRPLP